MTYFLAFRHCAPSRVFQRQVGEVSTARRSMTLEGKFRGPHSLSALLAFDVFVAGKESRITRLVIMQAST